MTACAPHKEEALRTTAGAQSGSMAPSYWSGGVSRFPLRLDISSDFNVSETQAIVETGNEWSTSIQNKAQLFDTSANTAEKGNINLNSYYDDTMGIYKLTSWPGELPATALAVTQIFGLRKNIGSSSERIEIQHADILVNYDYFSFSTNDTFGYDLKTVVLHEMGHFLGLYHDESSVNDSVMYPTISRYMNNQTPKQRDVNNIYAKYGISGGAVNEAMSSRGLASVKEEHKETESEPVIIHFEIHADGDEKIYIAKTGPTETPFLELQRLKKNIKKNKEFQMIQITNTDTRHSKLKILRSL